ncbi:GyrI-like domain-containing protein [Proteiniclasticum sp. BAD-10]|uniref:GyrI-like domain-containing protein n=1 Tax=Proteiniclasticum sediminis TaxID=2804028 RepID=A0A941CTX2_9CLOT|nr:GyrI-like domain-containing protein [Proteiniclasticum sediminis]MBR0577188.1 GyrI-like domain-containing protein [Proteiniclasticum sediminis]
MADAVDFKKLEKKLYVPGNGPALVEVPPMIFLMVDGQGNPNEEEGEYAKAVELLYGLSYTIKMSEKAGNPLPGFFSYVVPPLEGLWWTAEEGPFTTGRKEELIWTSMIRQPDFVTEEIFTWAKEELKKRKPHLELEKVYLSTYTEGLCVQMLHWGPYDLEAETVKTMEDFAREEGYSTGMSQPSAEGILRRHHEIYLNDPRKVAPEKMKTIIRHPLGKKG